MPKKLKRIFIDYDDNTNIDEVLMDRNSIVDAPAHGRRAVFFDDHKKAVQFSFDNDKRIVVGVAIEANKPIYRNANEQFNEPHEVVFTPKSIELIRDSFHRSNNLHKLNENHSGKDDDVVLIQSYIVGGKRNPKLPEIFEGQGLSDGTWIVGYKVLSDSLWGKIKSGDFSGFSVEVYLDYQSSKISKYSINQKQISMKKKANFWANFFKNESAKFESVQSISGTYYQFDGELTIGTILSVEGEDGELTPAANIEDVINVDGVDQAVTTDEAGAITALTDVVEEPEMADEILAGFARETRNAINALRNEFKAELRKVRNDFSKQAQKGTARKFSGSTKSALNLLNNKK